MGSPLNAVVLVSGGLDSATVLAVARHQGFVLHALSFRYGQRHAIEIDAARRVCAQCGVTDHRLIDIDLRQFGGSALTADLEVPKDRDGQEMGTGIPVTYVPARNTIFLAYALAWAEVLGSRDIFIGVNAVDYSGYPDCRPAYIEAFSRLANLATRSAVEGVEGVEGSAPVRIHAPLIDKTKAGIIQWGCELGVDFSITTSCYDPDVTGRACGRCDACQLRKRGFAELGMSDPAPYAT